MVTVRTAKNKGRQFERDCEASLKQIYPDIHMTHEVGYIMEYDLRDDTLNICIECKRLKGISWNQLIYLFRKLKEVAPIESRCYVLFQSNHQPCLVFTGKAIHEFQDFFGVPFIKHTPIRKVIKNETV